MLLSVVEKEAERLLDAVAVEIAVLLLETVTVPVEEPERVVVAKAVVVAVVAPLCEAVADSENEMLGVFVEDRVPEPESDRVPEIVAVAVSLGEIVGNAEPVAVLNADAVPDPD